MDLAKEIKITEHLLTLEELNAKLQTNNEVGITDSEADIRLKRDGPNAFTPPKQTPGWVLFMREMTTGFAIIIWLSALASFICYAIDETPQDVNLD
jgi:sodium/potassium-transporting ATPase subunit alpha